MLQLTPSERYVLQLLAKEAPTGEIASSVRLDASQLEPYLNALFAKMGAAGRSEALADAMRRGLLLEESPSSEIALS